LEKEHSDCLNSFGFLVFSLIWFWNHICNNLDEISFFGFKLGFWFAQQGSILIFVAIIFIYIQINEKTRSRVQRRHWWV